MLMTADARSGAGTPIGALLSIQAGRIQRLGREGAVDPLHRPWRSAFFKTPIHGTAVVGELGIEGDEQADTRHHGGPDRALLMYSADHFPFWRTDHKLGELGPGGFGENLTVTGLTEATVCLGDRLRLGPELLVEVSQPRLPCSNINRRWGRKGVMETVAATGFSGWYLRVIQPGTTTAGVGVILAERPHASLTVALAFDVHFGRDRSPELLESLLDCHALTDDYKRHLRARR